MWENVTKRFSFLLPNVNETCSFLCTCYAFFYTLKFTSNNIMYFFAAQNIYVASIFRSSELSRHSAVVFRNISTYFFEWQRIIHLIDERKHFAQWKETLLYDFISRPGPLNNLCRKIKSRSDFNYNKWAIFLEITHHLFIVPIRPTFKFV